MERDCTKYGDELKFGGGKVKSPASSLILNFYFLQILELLHVILIKIIIKYCYFRFLIIHYKELSAYKVS